RRLPAAAAAGSGGARTPVGEVDHRPRGAPQPAGTPAGLALLLGGRTRAGLLLLVRVDGALDLVLRGRRVLLGHRLEVLDARELAVAVLVGLLELLGELGIGLRFLHRDEAVLVLVERVEAGVIRVLADPVLSIRGDAGDP